MSNPAAGTCLMSIKRLHKDYEGSKLGMWRRRAVYTLFGLSARYPMEFHDGGQHLNIANTIILLKVALSVDGHSEGESEALFSALAGTDCGDGIPIEQIEWSGEIGRGLYPAAFRAKGEQIFLGFTTISQWDCTACM